MINLEKISMNICWEQRTSFLRSPAKKTLQSEQPGCICLKWKNGPDSEKFMPDDMIAWK